MTTMTDTTQVYRVYIKTTAGRRLGRDHQARVDRALRLRRGRGLRPAARRPRAAARAGAAMREYPDVPDVIVDGEFVEVDPPNKLVQTWRMLMDETMKDEGFTRLTYEIADTGDGVTQLTVIHELESAPTLAAMVAGKSEAEGAGGGWAWVLSDLKSLLESGSPMAG